MRVITFLGYFPNISQSVRLRGKNKIGFCDQVYDLIGRKEISFIKVYSSRAFPYNDLSHWKPIYDVRPILKKTSLYSPLVVIEDRPIFRKNFIMDLVVQQLMEDFILALRLNPKLFFNP